MTEPVPIADNLVAPLLLALRDCLCTELIRSPLGRVCRCIVTHNVSPPVMDGCDCTCEPAGQGDAWVQLVQLVPEPSLNFGIGPRACPTGWQAVIQLGTYRCIEIPEDANPLPAATVTETSLDLLGDMHALLRVLGCCEALDDRDAVVDFYQPIAPTGGCAGTVLQFRVALSGGPGGC